MGAGLRIVALPPDHAVQDIDTRLEAKDIVAQIDTASRLAVEFDHIKFHASSP
jgi:hypothetical protein